MRNKRDVRQGSCLNLPVKSSGCGHTHKWKRGVYVVNESKAVKCKFQRSKGWLEHILKLLKNDGRQQREADEHESSAKVTER